MLRMTNNAQYLNKKGKIHFLINLTFSYNSKDNKANIWHFINKHLYDYDKLIFFFIFR